jgi:hypothetical protein
MGPTIEVLIRAARPSDIPRMTVLLAELFSIESDFTPDVEKQIRGLSVLVAGPPGRLCVSWRKSAGWSSGWPRYRH